MGPSGLEPTQAHLEPFCHREVKAALQAEAHSPMCRSSTVSARSSLLKPSRSSGSVMTSGGAQCSFKYGGFRGGRALQPLQWPAVGACKVQAAEEADRPGLPDGRMRVHQPLHLGDHGGLERAHVLHNLRPQHVLNHLVAAGQGHWVGVVGGAPPERVRVEPVPDPLVHGHASQGHVGTRQPLCAGDNIWDDTLVLLESPQRSRPSEADHHLVGDVQDAVLIAQGPGALHVPTGVDQHAAGSDDRLDQETGNGRRQRHTRGLRLIAGPLEQVRQRTVHVHDARGGATIAEPPAEVSRRSEGAAGAAVVRPVVGQYFGTAGEAAREAQRHLVGFGAATWKEHARQVGREDLRQELSQPAPHFAHAEARVDKRKRLQLRCDGLPHGRRDRVAQVGAHRLRRPVQVALPVGVVQAADPAPHVAITCLDCAARIALGSHGSSLQCAADTCKGSKLLSRADSGGGACASGRWCALTRRALDTGGAARAVDIRATSPPPCSGALSPQHNEECNACAWRAPCLLRARLAACIMPAGSGRGRPQHPADKSMFIMSLLYLGCSYRWATGLPRRRGLRHSALKVEAHRLLQRVYRLRLCVLRWGPARLGQHQIGRQRDEGLGRCPLALDPNHLPHRPPICTRRGPRVRRQGEHVDVLHIIRCALGSILHIIRRLPG
eukprot:scaffold19380_cov107-Isochrysis_galbana.AAC.8